MSSPRSCLPALVLAFAVPVLPGCGDTINNTNTYITEAPEEPDGGADDLPEGTPTADTAPEDQVFDVFGGTPQHYWFVVDEAQVTRMNNREGDFPGGGGGFEDKYSPGGGNGTYADHLFVTTENPPTTVDYGKVQVRVVGQSSQRPWTPSTIPNLRVDTNEFVPDKRINNVEHLRFSNAQVGNIFREAVTYAVFRELGYPAPRTTYAWVGGNVWGPDVEIPYILTEVYKKAFCKHIGDPFGGGCQNLWEFASDLNSAANDPNSCQSGTCDNARFRQFAERVALTPRGDGFKAALSEFLDWPAFQKFHCLSWILSLGDGAIHAGNNIVIAERDDGYFQYLPYSVDISAGFQDWGTVPLFGMDAVSTGCQADDGCWAETIAMCEATVADFIALDPAGVAERAYSDVASAGMLRSGDDLRFEQLRNWYLNRVVELPGLLDQYRDGSPGCDFGWELCNGTCVPPGECFGGCDKGWEWCNGGCVPIGECFAGCGRGMEWCNGDCVPLGQCFGGCGPFPEPRPMPALPPPPDGAAGADAGAADMAIPVPCKVQNAYAP